MTHAVLNRVHAWSGAGHHGGEEGQGWQRSRRCNRGVQSQWHASRAHHVVCLSRRGIGVLVKGCVGKGTAGRAEYPCCALALGPQVGVGTSMHLRLSNRDTLLSAGTCMVDQAVHAQNLQSFRAAG